MRYRCGCLCCYTLFQRLALLSDTSLVQSAFKAETSRSVLHCEQESYYHRLLSHRAVHSHYSPVGSSGFVANGTRRLTFFATPSTADNGTAVRAVIGRVRNRRLRQLPDLYASATPHSLRSYGVCSVALSLSHYRIVANSFRQAAPKPTYAPTALCCRPLAPFCAQA